VKNPEERSAWRLTGGCEAAGHGRNARNRCPFYTRNHAEAMGQLRSGVYHSASPGGSAGVHACHRGTAMVSSSLGPV
jgi:hypothetical protein